MNFLPEITESLNALAIKIGFFALAIALLIKTPSQPSSIAIVASDAVPMPASTITGTLDCFTLSIEDINFIYAIPKPEPIGEAKGIIAEAPIIF